MGKETAISWTTHTFNPWIGCTKVSPGCDNCYAATLDARWGHDSWGKSKPRRVTSNSYWMQPLRWNQEAAESGRKDFVFCASLADVMDDEAPVGIREKLWQLIDGTPHLTWQLLTKRPHRYERYLPANGFPHGNVWLGTSAENQQFYDVRWPILRRAARGLSLISFISYEPALGPLSILTGRADATKNDYPDWLIIGAESGSKRRFFDATWAEKLKTECAALGVAYFVKQFSARTPEQGAALIPPELLIRQFPTSLGEDHAS